MTRGVRGHLYQVCASSKCKNKEAAAACTSMLAVPFTREKVDWQQVTDGKTVCREFWNSITSKNVKLVPLQDMINISIRFQFELLNACNGNLFGYAGRYTKHVCMFRSSKTNTVHSSNQNMFGGWWSQFHWARLVVEQFIQAVGNLKHIARQGIKSFEGQRGIQANTLI